MKSKILFLDDIFSDRLRQQLSPEYLAMDDNWVSAVETALTGNGHGHGPVFELAKHGDIHAWESLIEKEKPSVLLLDLFWSEEALATYKDRNRGFDISLETLKKVRKSFPDLCIVCYTVKPEEGLMEEAYNAGATFFLEKVPLALAEVQSPLKYILDYLLREDK